MLPSTRPFGIRCIDSSTGRPIPSVVLTTVDHQVWVSDNLGWVAVQSPDLNGSEVWFSVEGHGYNVPADGFGFRGVRLKIVPGTTRTIRLVRSLAGERIARLTGQGRDSHAVALGKAKATECGSSQQRVVGQDSAQAVSFQGEMLWFWGDTSVTDYPLGNFRTSGATAHIANGAAGPTSGFDFRYFRKRDGRLAPMFPGTEPGMAWMSGLVVLPDSRRQKKLVAYCARMKDLGTRLGHGHYVWDSAARHFVSIQSLPDPEDWRHLDGHPVLFDENGRQYVGGGFTFPVARCLASVERIVERQTWEAFTCLDSSGKVEHRDGRPVYRWQSSGPPIEPAVERALVESGQLRIEEARFLPHESDGNRVVPHGGSVVWNRWRRRWVAVFTGRNTGSTPLGDVWYAEADHPTGPWRRAVRVATHSDHSFYNPVVHPFLNSDNGRVIWFEGTFTKMFTRRDQALPRHEYNQVLYRVDLADRRLAFAQEK